MGVSPESSRQRPKKVYNVLKISPLISCLILASMQTEIHNQQADIFPSLECYILKYKHGY